MPAPLLSRTVVVQRVLATFRDRGYDGASLADLSAATGLGRSSLSHYFPGGKEEMAREVLAVLGAQLDAAAAAARRSERPPAKRLGELVDALDALYEGGTRACLLERLAASVASRAFRSPLRAAFATWTEAVETIARDAGLPRRVARARAEDFVIRVEGALVVAAATGDPAVFERTLAALRTSTLRAARS